MTISKNLSLAIPSMDAYNRGYNPGIAELGSSGAQIGEASIDRQSDIEDNSPSVNSGFYAISYNVGGVSGFSAGQKVISYRGTDNYNIFDSASDLWNGWTIGAGFSSTSRAGLESRILSCSRRQAC